MFRVLFFADAFELLHVDVVLGVVGDLFGVWQEVLHFELNEGGEVLFETVHYLTDFLLEELDFLVVLKNPLVGVFLREVFCENFDDFLGLFGTVLNVVEEDTGLDGRQEDLILFLVYYQLVVDVLKPALLLLV